MPLKLNIEEYESEVNDISQILKEYHRVKDSPAQLREFMNGLDEETVKRMGIYIPGYTPKPIEFLDDRILRHCSAVAIQHTGYWPMYNHAHSFVEILYVGAGYCQNITDSGVVNMTAGDFLIIPPGLSHMLFTETEGWFINYIFRTDNLLDICHTVFREPCLLMNYFMDILMGKKLENCLLCHVEDNATMYNLSELMLNESIHRADNEVLLGYLHLILRHLYLESEGHVRSKEKGPPLLFEIYQIMQNEFTTLTLKDLAQRLHFSSDYISRLIKSATQKTFSDLLLEIRMKNACLLLLTTQLPISEIAIQCGYPYPDRFYKRFKAYMGMTPAAYRESNNTR